MLKLLGRLIVGILALIGLAAVAGAAMFASAGISARQEPSSFEAAMAPRLRSLAIPASARQTANPIPASAEAIAEGMEHYADHCAVCHANDGSGDTEMGRAMYPRVPDMRKPVTQNLSDGELFYIIENGVRLTGMPAWAHDSPDDNWKLVHFIRHQPKLTAQELARMKALNPKAADEEEPPPPAKTNAPAKPPHRHTHPRK
ncbi:MAG TPA: c-type cytochrome [Vicinamibacterales bacterium]|nr:c-type cytochrome [Vicinamibacterales bacterium]